MIEFSIRKKDYTIGQMKVRHYYEVQDLHFMDSLEAKIKFISTLADCPEEELKTLSKGEFLAIWNAVQEKFIHNRAKDTTLMRTLHLNGTDYGLVHLDELTIGEFADLDVLQNDPLREKKLHNMMAILYRPLTGWTRNATYYTVDPYDSKACQQRAEDFLEMDIDSVKGTMSFFLSITNYSLNRIVDSLENQMQTNEERKVAQDVRWTINQLLEDGLSSSSSSQEKILSSLIVLQESLSERLSTMQATSKINESKNESKLRGRLQSFVSGLNFKRTKQTI